MKRKIAKKSDAEFEQLLIEAAMLANERWIHKIEAEFQAEMTSGNSQITQKSDN